MKTSSLQNYINMALEGTQDSVVQILNELNSELTIEKSKYIDYALSHVSSEEGIDTLKYYLFHGTQIQRNYCALYFGRIGEYPLIREAFDQGLIDAKQAFSR